MPKDKKAKAAEKKAKSAEKQNRNAAKAKLKEKKAKAKGKDDDSDADDVEDLESILEEYARQVGDLVLCPKSWLQHFSCS